MRCSRNCQSSASRPQRAETQDVPRLPGMEGAAEVSGDKRGDKTSPAGWKLTARAVSYCPPSEFSHVFSAFPLLMKRLLRYFTVLQFLYMSECTFHSVLNVFGVVFGLLDCNVTDNL